MYDRQLTPSLIHQIYLEEGRKPSFHHYEDARQSCRNKLDDWTHYLWTDDNATDFVDVYYPHISPHYRAYRQTIQRTNILRYLLLHHYGGVYLDLDITCRQPLGHLLHLPFMTPAAYPTGVNNAFILSRPGHPFLTYTINRIASHDIQWPMPYVENMLSTGCMFFSNQWNLYNRLDAELEPEDKLLLLSNESGGLERQMLRGAVTTSLFVHEGASSWHSSDAAIIIFIGQYYQRGIAIFLGMVVLVAAACLRRSVYRRDWHWV